MKQFALALIIALAPSLCSAGIVFNYETGKQLYVRFDDSSNTAVNLTEGSTLKAGRYTAADAAIDTAGLAAGNYTGRIFIGTAGAQSSSDVLVGVVNDFTFGASTQTSSDSRLISALFGTATADSGSGTVGRAFHYLLLSFASAGKFTTNALSNAPTGGGGTEPDDRDLEPVQHVWQLKRSGDGTLRSTNPLYVHAGDTIRAGWNCDIPSVLPPGTVISTEDEPELVGDTADIAITAIGHDAKIAKVELAIDDTAEAGSHWVKVLVTNTNGGGPIAVYGEVVIQAEPE